MSDISSTVTALIQQLEGYVHDAGQGLPDELFLFVSRITPLINVDLLVQDDARRTLLTWRTDAFFGPGWHVPGGIIRNKELAAERIRAVAKLELGLPVTFDPAPILVSESIRTGFRDRGHAVSLLYRCELSSPPDPRRQCAEERAPLSGQWLWHQHCPENLIPEQRAYVSLIG